MATPSSRISTLGEGCPSVTAFIVCYMELPSCVCCKTDVLWLSTFYKIEVTYKMLHHILHLTLSTTDYKIDTYLHGPKGLLH